MRYKETRKEKRKKIDDLYKQGRYREIVRKYGRNAYRKAMYRRGFNEIKKRQGLLPALLWKVKHIAFYSLEFIGVYALTNSVGIKGISYATHYEQIEEYNEKNEEYAKKVRKNEYSDMQIIMKVMDDMWNSIQGYKTPDEEVSGYLELNLATEEGYGVCRNMAADVAKKLNEIDPKYNARVKAVYLSENSDIQTADIEQKILPEDDEEITGLHRANVDEEETKIEKKEKIFGNHVVALVDIPSDNIMLVIDPTNACLGIYQNGKIRMFNDLNGQEWDVKELSTASVTHDIKSYVDAPLDYKKSFEEPKLSNEELEEKYGVNAQDRALNEVRIKGLVDRQKFDKYKVDVAAFKPKPYVGQNTTNSEEKDKGIEL